MRRHERELRRLAAAHGATFAGRTRGGHFRITRADGTRIVTSSTPSDQGTLRIIRQQLRRRAP